MTQLPVLEAKTTFGAVDTDVIFSFQDVGRKAIAPRGPYAPLIEKFRKTDAFTAKSGEVQFLRFGGKSRADNVLIVGLGVAGELTEEKLRVAGGSAWARLSSEKSETVAIHLDSMWEARGLLAELAKPRMARAFAEGLLMSCYEVRNYKSGKKSKDKAKEPKGVSRLVFLTQDKELKARLDAELEQVAAVGLAVNVTRDWSNEPSNYGTPEYYAAEAQKLAKAHGLKCRVLTERDAERERMGLFLGVGQGAERESRIVIVEYAPRNPKSTAKTVALVGKGVTFDSGGISIKPSARMEDMKHDMTGAATVMGAVLLAAQWQVPNRVVGIMAFTENMPDGGAIQPGNVLTSRSGKTVEVINTDAEGRLVLADVLDYVQDRKPDAVIDIATLTGAVLVALGKQCCAILGNDDELIEAVRKAGAVNSERIWQLPLYDEYFEDLKSDYADMKNSANDSYGGTIRGAAFLKQFIRKGTRWAHLDIAATAYGLSHLSYFPKKGASGATVRTLAQFALDF